MAWDKDKPAGSTKLRNADDDLRANNAALETAISEGHEFATGGNQTGKHVTPTFVDNGGTPASDPSSNERKLYNNGGTMFIRDNGGIDTQVAPIPSGTPMFFKTSSAPSGWTFASENNDRVLLNTSTESDGGNTGGTWSLSTDGHALTIAEMPGHTHSYDDERKYQETGGGGVSLYRFDDGAGGKWTGSTGGNDPHSHTINDGDTWRPAYVKVITCTKD
jgi:hypothetical protein